MSFTFSSVGAKESRTADRASLSIFEGASDSSCCIFFISSTRSRVLPFAFMETIYRRMGLLQGLVRLVLLYL